MSEYDILRFKKLKTLGAIEGSAKHTFRQRPTRNADASRTGLNQHAGASTSEELLAAFRDKLLSKRRSDNVLAIEAVITTSPGWMRAASDQERSEFFSRGRTWLHDTFGKENVIYYGTHLDELTPHAVAYVIPLKGGRLNAKHWLGGR